MRENCPFPATQADTLPAPAPTVSSPARRGVAGHSAAKFPHRRVFVLASWRAARSWISLAYPVDLDAALVELKAKLPELVANVDRLEQAALREASTYENEPAASPDAFQAALREWERAATDALAALDCARPGEVSHV